GPSDRSAAGSGSGCSGGAQLPALAQLAADRETIAARGIDANRGRGRTVGQQLQETAVQEHGRGGGEVLDEHLARTLGAEEFEPQASGRVDLGSRGRGEVRGAVRSPDGQLEPLAAQALQLGRRRGEELVVDERELAREGE